MSPMQINPRIKSHVFWGRYAPLSTLTGGAIIVLGSTRLSYALICAGAILWVYVLTAAVYFFARHALPRGRAQGHGPLNQVILLLLSSFLGSLYLLLQGLLNPLLVLSSWFCVILVPPCYTGSQATEDLEGLVPLLSVARVALEGGGLALVTIALSLIREPLGLGTLSFPGGPGGILELFSTGDDSFLPIWVLSSAAGGLIILGYTVAIFRYFRAQYYGGEEET